MQITLSRFISLIILSTLLLCISFYSLADVHETKKKGTNLSEIEGVSEIEENIIPPALDLKDEQALQAKEKIPNNIDDYFNKIKDELKIANDKLEPVAYDYLIEQIQVLPQIKAILDKSKLPGADEPDANLDKDIEPFFKQIKLQIESAETSLGDEFEFLRLKITQDIKKEASILDIVSESTSDPVTADPIIEDPAIEDPVTEDPVTGDSITTTSKIVYYFFACVLIILAVIISLLIYQLRNKRAIPEPVYDHDDENEYKPIKVAKKNKESNYVTLEDDIKINKKIDKSFRPHDYGEIPLLQKISNKSKTSLTIYTEKIVNKGEDAKPLLTQLDDNDYMISVFDGLGGAGGSNITSSKDVVNTHAYFGSRILRDCFVQLSNAKNKKVITDKELLKQYIIDFMNDDLVNFSQKDVKMLSKKPTKLPTTFVASVINQSKADLKLDVLWAGDSRCFSMMPGQSITTLTKDDTKDSDDDPLNLKMDSPMINYVNAEGNFYINQNKIKLTGKNILIVATDGCFGYFPSPIHFEYSLLKSLSESTSIEAWQKMISQDIKNVTKDDATMSLIAFGWDNFLEIKDDFEKDYINLKNNFIEPFEAEEKRINDLKQNLVDSEKKLKEVISKKTEEFLKNR